MYCDLLPQYIQVRKLFKGGNYSRAETIRGNTVLEKGVCETSQKFSSFRQPIEKFEINAGIFDEK